MYNTIAGLKSGLVAGVVYGLIDGAFSIFFIHAFHNVVFYSIKQSVQGLSGHIAINAYTLYNVLIYAAIPVAITAGIAIGLILGAILVYAYNKIPGKTAVRKGLSFGLVIWFIFNVLFGLGNLELYGTVYYLAGLGGGIMPSMVFGYLTGFLYEKWKEKPSDGHDSSIVAT